MTSPNLQIQATSPAGPSVGFGLSGDSQITRSGGSGAGGWQIVDRPRRAATTEWVDWGPFQLTISLILDGYSTGTPVSVEPAVAMVESWEVPASGSTPPLPPILKITGPVPHNELSWVVQNIVWKEAIRDPATGVRYQQNLDMVLWQYLPPQIALQATPQAATPAASARAGSGASGTTYTVKSGDTLLTIATSLYGSYPFWTLLANANGIIDPASVTPGQVLTVPAKTPNPPALNPAFAAGAGAANIAAALAAG